MPRERTYRSVGREFLDDAPIRVAVRSALPVDADTAWRALADAPSWAEWIPGAKEFAWTSEPPHGVGSTRSAGVGAGVLEERFVAWEPGRRMVFVMERGTVPTIGAMAEEWTLEPRGAECQAVARDAIELAGRAAVATPVAQRLLTPIVSRMPRAFADWLATNGHRYAEADS
ncbi:MAG: SRPBCC family protein [Actinomycetota bacterium]